MPESMLVLLIDDDEDDYVLTRDTLAASTYTAFDLRWEPTYELGLKALKQGAFDACIVDYRLGIKNGAELIATAKKQGIDIPFLLMTGVGNTRTDLEAMHAGADDYIEKGQAFGPLLERALRYAARHKTAERQLALALEQFRTLAENSQDFIARIDNQLCYVYMNPAMETASGLTFDEYHGRSVRSLPSNSLICAEWAETIAKALASGTNMTATITGPGTKGKSLIINWHIALERDAKGRINSLLCSGRDITQKELAEKERRRLQQELERARRFEALGRMAGGLSHDFNNLLTVINGYAAMLVESLPPHGPLLQDAQEILDAGTQGADLISQLLSFSQHAMTELMPVDVNRLVTETLRNMQDSIPDSIAIQTQLDALCNCACVGRNMLSRTLGGIITNSIEAIQTARRPEGHIIIRTWMHTQETDSQKQQLSPGQYVGVSIADDGIGMSSKDLSRVFEPFYTHKARTRGTGLTLAVAYGVVRQCQGDIIAHSVEGKGTTITFYLPVFEEGQ